MNGLLLKSNHEEERQENSLIQCFLTVLQIEGVKYEKKIFDEIKENDKGKIDIYSLKNKLKRSKLKIKIIKPTIDEIAELDIPLIAKMKNSSYLIIGKSNTRVMLIYKPEEEKKLKLAK